MAGPNLYIARIKNLIQKSSPMFDLLQTFLYFILIFMNLVD